jgi:CTP:molybdopterin cytidylyltransferase MocA
MVGVLLAAGESRRMGSPKALVKVRGRSFLVHGVQHLWAACDCVVVVLGSKAAAIQRDAEREFDLLVRSGGIHPRMVDASRRGSRGLEVRFAVNAGWRSGMLSSVRAGLRDALELKPRAVLLLPVDHPVVRPETVVQMSAVMEEALKAAGNARDRARFAYALVPRYLRRRGHPVALSPALARAVAADAGAESLSDAVRRNARLVGYLDVSDSGVTLNRNSRGARR